MTAERPTTSWIESEKGHLAVLGGIATGISLIVIAAIVGGTLAAFIAGALCALAATSTATLLARTHTTTSERSPTMDNPTTSNPQAADIATVHQPGYDPDWCGYLVEQAASKLRAVGEPVLADHIEALERWHARHNPDHLYGPRS